MFVYIITRNMKNVKQKFCKNLLYKNIENILEVKYNNILGIQGIYFLKGSMVMAGNFMANGMRITILSPRQVQRRYLGKMNGTHMSKWALEALANGWKIACVYRKGLNDNSIFHNKDGLDVACAALTRYLNNYMINLTCVDMSHPDAFYLAYKE